MGLVQILAKIKLKFLELAQGPLHKYLKKFKHMHNYR